MSTLLFFALGLFVSDAGNQQPVYAQVESVTQCALVINQTIAAGPIHTDDGQTWYLTAAQCYVRESD